MKIIVENAAFLNGGDAAIGDATVLLCRRAFGPGTEILFADQATGKAQGLFPDLRFITPHSTRTRDNRLFRAADRLTGQKARGILFPAFSGLSQLWDGLLHGGNGPSFRPYQEADLIMMSGGTFITTHYGVERLVTELSKRASRGKPLIFMTQTIDSVADTAPFRKLGRLMAQSPLILVRDSESRNLVARLAGSAANVHVVPDAVFCLASAPAIEARIEAASRPLPGSPRVAVSVREWPHFRRKSRAAGMKDYTKAIAATVTHLVRAHDAEVTFISTCQGVPAYQYDDSQLAARIHAGLDPAVAAQVQVDRRFRTPRQLLDVLDGFDLTISTRMHMAIMSMCRGLPVLPISYERKMNDLYRNMDLEDWVTDIEDIEAGALSRLVDRAFAERDTLQASLGHHALRLSAEAMRAADLMSAALRDRR